VLRWRVDVNLSQSLRGLAKRLPDHPAITSESGTIAYGQLEDNVGHIAGGLRGRLALPPGSRVGVAMENCGEYLQVLYGIWRAGLVAVPMNAKLHEKELAFILANAECRACFCTPDLADRIAAPGIFAPGLPGILSTGSKDYTALLTSPPITDVSSSAEDEAWLFYTSGTTGRPKGAVLTHRNLVFMASCYYADIDQLDERDVKVHAAPLSHGSGLYAIPHLAKGSHNIVLSGSFEPDRIFDVLEKHQNVTMFGAPTMVSRLINHRRAGSSNTHGMKTLYFGGAPMYVSDLKKALEIFGPKLTQIYGQGESPMTISYVSKRLLGQTDHPRREDILASCGVARSGVDIKVVDEDGRELPAGEIGEVITRSDCVMRGYWNNAEANARSLRDGWLWTGDLGFIDAEGFLTLRDRSKDMIISGGSNIYPREIEEVLLTHPNILECAVIGRQHPDWGEEVVAYVVARPGATVTPQELDALCLNNIARYKRPRRYRIVESLPKNNYGKVLKTELRLLKENSDA
jgi:acyl-CoA synthetase (AMP-forming)/AMP-acid ligase II